jgi:hypothetical protein
MSTSTVEHSNAPAAPRRRRSRALALATGAGMLAVTGLLATSGVASADPGSDNAGDVWVGNAGAPPVPGHQMDPHLTCTTIDVWGAQLAAPGGTFTVSGVNPDGSTTVLYTGTWVNDDGTGAPIATVDPNLLVADLPPGTAAQPQEGYHFQVVVDQAEQKSKTFWVDGCATQPGGGNGFV